LASTKKPDPSQRRIFRMWRRRLQKTKRVGSGQEMSGETAHLRDLGAGPVHEQLDQIPQVRSDLLFEASPIPMLPVVADAAHQRLRDVHTDLAEGPPFPRALRKPTEVALEVRPAQLSLLGRDLVVGRQAVRHPDAGVVRPQQAREGFAIAPTVDPVDGDTLADPGPEPVEDPAFLPRSLVHVRQRARPERLESLLEGRLERTRHAVLDRADRAHRHRDAEGLRKQPRRLAPAQAVPRDQRGRQGLEARAEGAPRDVGWERRDDLLAAAGADPPVEPVFGDRRHERRNLDDLVTTRSRTIREQIPAATLRALLGLVVDDIIDPILVDQLPRLAGVTGLTALLLARGRTAALAALGPWPIRGRRLRRVPRV
jgi:hypothetical protein